MIADAPRVGRVVAGRYRVERASEQGAAPFAARAVRVVDGVEVLIFVAPPSTVRADGVQRFVELARPLRGLAEGLWMMVLDEGVDADGAPFLVTSSWDRETVEQRVQRSGAINLSVAAEVALDALGALGALHDRDLAHRGLTCEDVLLVMGEDGGLHGHVLAGGMLRALACGARDDDSALRAVSASPEQRRGELGDAESDVWAVGVMLYRMLTASMPFEGQTAADIALAAATQDAAPLPPRFPEGIARVIERALSKRAAARYPDARAMRDDLLGVMVEAGLREAGAAAKSRPAAPIESDDDAGDLDALIELAKFPSQRPSMASPSSLNAPRPSLEGPAPAAASARPSAPVDRFDLDSELPPPMIEIPRAAPVPNIPVAPSSPAPSFQSPDPSFSPSRPRLSREFVRAEKPKGGTIGAGSALLVVLAVTLGAGYLSRDFLRRTFSPSPQSLRDLEVPSEPVTARDAASPSGDVEPTRDVSESEFGGAPYQPRIETQSPAVFGEQLRVALPQGLDPLQRHQFITHIHAAPSPLAARVGGFVSCVDGRVFAHPGGVNGVLREAPVSTRCEGVDLALADDMDGDSQGELVAIDPQRGGLLVITSRRLRVERSLPLANAWAVVSGLSFGAGRRSEPAAAVYLSGEGVIPTVVALGLRTGRVYWRADSALHVGAPGDYGLSVTTDLDQDGSTDLIVGLLREGRHCVTALSGATGLAIWRVPRCTEAVGAQYLSVGPDVNEDARAEVALGSAFGHRISVLSGRDGAELLSAPPASETAAITLGQGMQMTPDLARDGFPDLVVPSSDGNSSQVLIFSANDGHQQASIAVSFDGAPVSISAIRLQYVENFVFSGSRSLILATPAGVQVFGASPRS